MTMAVVWVVIATGWVVVVLVVKTALMGIGGVVAMRTSLLLKTMTAEGRY